MISCLVRKIRISGWCLVFFVQPSAFAEPMKVQRADADIVLVEHASFHQLVFANDDIAVLNNFYPPGGDSGFHSHFRDLFYVVIRSGRTSAQRPGQPLSAAPEAPAGAAGYSEIGAEPREHRVVNSDEGEAQFLVVEIRRASPLGNEISSREDVPQYARILDNRRMRAWRLIVEPGQSVPAISQGGNGVRIVVRGGLLTTVTSGRPDQTLALKAGDFAIQDSGVTRALRNSGTETIELVELELK